MSRSRFETGHKYISFQLNKPSKAVPAVKLEIFIMKNFIKVKNEPRNCYLWNLLLIDMNGTSSSPGAEKEQLRARLCAGLLNVLKWVVFYNTLLYNQGSERITVDRGRTFNADEKTC